MEDLNFSVSAPGKVILFGEHSVVFKKAAVCTTISKRLHVSIKPEQDNVVSVSFSQIGVNISCNLDTLNEIVKQKCPSNPPVYTITLKNPESLLHEEYVSSLHEDFNRLNIDLNKLEGKVKSSLLGFLYVLRGMCNTLTFKLMPFHLSILSDLDIGAGTGSSAAFSVALCGSIYYMKRVIEARKCSNKDNKIQTDFSIEDKQIINGWALCIEKLMHGRPSGIDNTTCTFGSVVIASQASGKLTFDFLDNIPAISLLLINTGVSRNTSQLVAQVQNLKEKHGKIVESIMNAMDEIAKHAIDVLKSLGSNSSEQSVELFKTLSSLMEINHGLLRTIGVSHQSLEKIIQVCNSHGLSSKLTGAGGGGYAIALVPPNFPKSKLDLLKNNLEPEFKVTEISIASEGVKLTL